MPSAKEFKDKGNDAFKKGDFVGAIGHYTDAIVADRKDPVYLLNRSAAYLKLAKNEDAERDASSALSIDPKLVKALFRRAQARNAMQKWASAVQDLNALLKIEPKNDAAKAELDKAMHAMQRVAPSAKKVERRRIPITIIDDTPEASTSTSIAAPKSPVTEASRRRVPITVIDDVEEEPAPAQPSSPRILPPALPVKSILKPTPSTSTPKSPASDGPRTVGGGIFRKDGSHTPFTTSSTHTPKTGVGYTLYLLSRALGDTQDPSERWKVLSSTPHEELPQMLSSITLDAPIMSLLISAISYGASTLRAEENSDDRDRAAVAYHMTVLSSAPRFMTVRLFLSAKEKEVARVIWEKIGERGEVEDAARKRWNV